MEKYLFQKEAAVVLYKRELISFSLGTPTQVIFNFDEVWDAKQQISQLATFNPRHLHFIHVHPPSFFDCSQLDIECMQGFNIAFGYPVLFSIVCFDETGSAKMKSFRFEGEMVDVETKIPNDDCLQILRVLSS